MAELRALMREDDDTASTTSELDAADAAELTTLRVGDVAVVTHEATHAFGASGADQSGNVVWGAARMLAERVGKLEDLGGKTVIELGCGCAVPAVICKKRGAARVVATDASEAVVRRAARTAVLNGVDVEARCFDWTALDPTLLRVADVVLCADCVYCAGAAPLLHQAMRHVAKPGATVYACCKKGRRGVDTFWGLMAQTFEEVEALDAEDHALRAYRVRPRAALLEQLAAKRGELRACRRDVSGLKEDLRNMAATMQTDVATLLGALTAAAKGQADARVRAFAAAQRVAALEAEAAAMDAASAAGGPPA